MGVAYNSKIVTDGLVFCLDAGNRKSYPGSGTAWTDLSGRGGIGTLTNMEVPGDYSTANGGFLTFDGLNEYIDCGSNSVLSISNNLTVSVWLRFPTGYGNPTWNSILAKRSVSANYAINYNPNTNQFQWFYLGNGGGILTIPLTSNFSTNTWTNVCGVFSQNLTTTNAFLYKNGSLLNSSNLTGNVPSVSGKFTIGCYGDTSFTEFSPITISQVSIYNRALTTAEIQQNYLATKSRYFS